MAKNRKPRQRSDRKLAALPTNTKYKAASAIDTSTAHGRCLLWKQRIDRATDMLKIDDRDETQKATWKFIDGSYALGSGDKVYTNEAFPALSDLIDKTVPAIPDTRVDARQRDQKRLAKLCEALCDATLDSDLVQAYDSLIDAEWDETGWGIAWLKMSWRRERHPHTPAATQDETYLAPHVLDAMEENADPTQADISDNDDHAIHLDMHLQEAEKRIATDPEDPAIAVLQEHIDAHQPYLEALNWEGPIMERVGSKRMRYDPDAQRWNDVGWVAELAEDLVADLQKIPGIKNLRPENCPPLDEFDAKIGDSERLATDFDYENTRVQVWKIHDRRNGRLIVIPADVGNETKPILEADWPYGPCDIYYPIRHIPVPGRIHGQALRTLIAATLEEIARTRRYIRVLNAKLAAAKKVVPSEAGLSRKEQGDLANVDKWVAEVNAEALATMQDWSPPVPPAQLFAYLQTLRDALRELTGQDVMHQGGDTPHKITASEAQLRGQYQSARLERRQEVISRALGWAARNILMFFRMFASQRVAVRVAGEQGFDLQYLDPGAIPEDLVVRLDIKSYAEAQQGKEMEAAMQYFQIVTPYIPPGIVPIELLVWIGRKLGVQNPEAVLPEILLNMAQQGGMVPPEMGGEGEEAPAGAGQGGGPPSGPPNVPNLQLANVGA